MAKQRGIHQISGKVNNLCYYEQKYVRGGLIRRINEAMSGRLKIDPMFENTRNANRLFGAASLLAKSFLQMFDAYSDLLTYPSRQAKLTRGFLGFIREHVRSSGNPEINISRMSYAEFLSITDSVMKNKLGKFFPTFKRYYTDLGIEEQIELLIRSNELESYAKRNNLDCLFIRIAGPYDVGVMLPNSDSQKYTQPIVSGMEQVYDTVWSIGSGDYIFRLNVGVPRNHRGYYTISITPSDNDDYADAVRFFSLACAGFFITNVTY